MADFQLRMDPLNPGQFFACCGLLELMSISNPATLGCFEMASGKPRLAFFRITEALQPVSVLVANLRETTPEFDDGEPATKPIKFKVNDQGLVLDWWFRTFREGTTSLKCWAGQVTTENLICGLLPLLPQQTDERLFEVAAMTKAKFGVDPRSAWNALDIGFSPNEHGLDSAVFPAVDVLAAIGLQTFRPDASSRDRIPYFLWETPLPSVVARLAFRCPWDGLQGRSCEFAIGSRGQSYKYFSFGKESQRNSNGH